AVHGANELHPRVERSALRELAKRFRSPLVAILLAASVVSAFTGDVASFAMIVAMVMLSVVIDFLQEHRAAHAAEALRRRVQVHATVLRDGKAVSLPIQRLVPGDIVRLTAGSVIPADGRLLECNGLHVNEALLTGEPFPVEKRAAGGEGPADVFMGTSVVSGTGTLRALATGGATRVGAIARSLATEAPPSTFERGTRAFGMLIMRLTAFMVLFVLLVNTAMGRPLPESFLFALALAVGLTPELLPMIVSVTLARGAVRLAGRHVIVKRLTAIESLGSMDVLCTDKTGTLTESRIRLHAAIDSKGNEDARVLELAALNSAHQAGLASPLDEAILAVAKPDPRWRKVAEIPFDFERRRVAVLLEDGARRIVVVKGAAETLLDLSHEAHAQVARLEGEGLRVLGIAYKEVGAGAGIDEAGLAFAGFLAFVDPPKRGAGKALAELAAAGVRLKILTGDSEAVTRHLCGALGIEVRGVLAGAQLARLDDMALARKAGETTIFCRVDPMQKNRIVNVLRSRGHVVGFLGDGINDAPALHSADVGFSVNNAVDVAKEAADLIMLRRDLEVVHGAVLEGRRTFVNIRKYILMGTSSNFGNMFSMAAAALFLPFLPLLPTQILLNNLLYDISEIPIPLDRADAAETASPQQWDMKLIRDFMWVLGPVSSLFDLLTFWVLLAVLNAQETLFRTGWFIESLCTQVLVIFVIRTRLSPFASRPGALLAGTSLAVIALALALPWMPFAGALGFAPPPPVFFGVLVVLVASYLVLAEVAKRAFYRHRKAR
ncbi:MAG TPA: magnesium-translocating P-type ATPase, partial [Usitatibacter sp.]|nr:magnesium-translocating P-type ATPase [Usitatibacter sp.]